MRLRLAIMNSVLLGFCLCIWGCTDQETIPTNPIPDGQSIQGTWDWLFSYNKERGSIQRTGERSEVSDNTYSTSTGYLIFTDSTLTIAVMGTVQQPGGEVDTLDNVVTLSYTLVPGSLILEDKNNDEAIGLFYQLRQDTLKLEDLTYINTYQKRSMN